MQNVDAEIVSLRNKLEKLKEMFGAYLIMNASQDDSADTAAARRVYKKLLKELDICYERKIMEMLDDC